ncbi:MAG: ABC transporter permease [Firmicutes bacterium]|nr:ABC transporter permease [Bacillota bacterium]
MLSRKWPRRGYFLKQPLDSEPNVTKISQLGSKAMNLRRIWAIIRKDLLEAMGNKTILVAIFLPLAASLSLAVIDNPQKPQQLRVGVTGPTSYPLEVYLVASAGDMLHVTHYESMDQGRQAVTRGKIDALVTHNQTPTQPDDFTVYIDGSNPGTQLATKEILEPILAAYLGRAPQRTMELVVLNQGRASQALIPLWLTITTVMVGVMILSGSFAEEKEKGTLDNIRISPATHGEILLSKGMSGILLILLVSGIMLALNQVELSQKTGYIGLGLLLLLGATIFTAIGLLIGLSAKTQSAARAISTIVYFPLIFPALAADISPATSKFAAFLPSFYLYRGLKEALQFQASLATLKPDLVGLGVFVIIFSGATLWGYQRVLRKER